MNQPPSGETGQWNLKEIRVGDVWEFTTNNGVIVRHVKSMACGVVSYLNNGVLRRCMLQTFKNWTRGAALEFRLPASPEKGSELK